MNHIMRLVPKAHNHRKVRLQFRLNRLEEDIQFRMNWLDEHFNKYIVGSVNHYIYEGKMSELKWIQRRIEYFKKEIKELYQE